MGDAAFRLRKWEGERRVEALCFLDLTTLAKIGLDGIFTVQMRASDLDSNFSPVILPVK